MGALSLFGQENLGRIEEITIKGLDIEMIIVNKYNLVLIAIMIKDFVKQDIRIEAEKALDMFYSLYKDKIGDYCDVCEFESFKKTLYNQIDEYFNRITVKNKNATIGDFGFFTDAIAKLKNGQE